MTVIIECYGLAAGDQLTPLKWNYMGLGSLFEKIRITTSITIQPGDVFENTTSDPWLISRLGCSNAAVVDLQIRNCAF
jgi:hypothetical protein